MAAPGTYVYSSKWTSRSCIEDRLGSAYAETLSCGPLLSLVRWLFFTVHKGGNHWVLVAVDMTPDSPSAGAEAAGPGPPVMYYIDPRLRVSKGKKDVARTAVGHIQRYLRDDWVKQGNAGPPPFDWTRAGTFKALRPGVEIPEQTNTYDCGPFLVAFARCLALGHPKFAPDLVLTKSTFRQEDMGVFRRRLAAELLDRTLDV